MIVRNANHLDKGLLRGLCFAPIRHVCAFIENPNYRYYHILATRLFWQKKNSRQAKFAGHRLRFQDRKSLLSSAAHIFVDRIYDCGNFRHKPFMIDAGANIGLAQLYWTLRYPDGFESICFEPDPQIFETLKSNMNDWRINSTLIQAALSDVEGEVPFSPDGADGGHLSCGNSSSIKVKTKRVSSFIDRKVDFLKIDIEGAEFRVLQDLDSSLHLVDYLFIEYHQKASHPNDLDEILAILKRNQFNFWLQSEVSVKDLWIRDKPSEQSPLATLRIFCKNSRYGS